MAEAFALEQEFEPKLYTNYPFVVLRGREHGNTFITSNSAGKDMRLSGEGELWYDVVDYVTTIEEGQEICRRG